MSLNYVTLVLDLYDAQGNPVVTGAAALTPSVVLTDPGVEYIPQAPIPAVFHAGGLPSVSLLATDNTAPLPNGWTWGITFSGVPGSPPSFSFYLPYTGGATQYLSALAQVPAVSPTSAYLPLPSGTPSAGQVPVATGSGQSSAWTALVPLTTKGDLLYENATPAPARLAVGSAGQLLGVSGGVPAWGMGLTLLATTGNSGYALVNGTGTIITWTAPNDGALHRVAIAGNVLVTSGETGGQINMAMTLPNGTAESFPVVTAGNSTGLAKLSAVGNGIFFVEANTAVTISQATALTGGAATGWFELWGS